LTNDYLIRRRAADFGIPLITNIQLAQRFVEALSKVGMAELQIKSWQEYGAPEREPDKTPRLPIAELVQSGDMTGVGAGGRAI
jgi:hypothetical protein